MTSKRHQSGTSSRCGSSSTKIPFLTFDSKTIAIYALIDPIRNVPFYIGQSCDPFRREIEHTMGNNFAPEAKDEYIARLVKLGHFPYMEIIERCSPADAHWRERHWINWYSIVGCPLTNGESLHWRRKHLSEVGLLYLPTRFDIRKPKVRRAKAA